MFMFFSIQQLSGIFVIFIYAAQFSEQAGVSIDVLLSAVIIGFIRLCVTLAIAFISDKLGRRPLAITSSCGMFICMLGLTLCTVFHTNQTSFYWLPTVILFSFIVSGSFGILTLPFAMVAELYPQRLRGFGAGITISFAYLLSFIHVKTFPFLFTIFGNTLIFSFYALVSLIGIIFSTLILPETKGKTLQELEKLFE
jgi:MFS family permease